MNRTSNLLTNPKSLTRRLAGVGLACAVATTFLTTTPVVSPAYAATGFNTQNQDATLPDNADLWVSVNFKGGTAADYVDAIRKAARNANIIVMPDAEMIEIPPVQLKAVALASALEFLDHKEATVENARYIINVERIITDSIALTDEERDREGVTAHFALPIYSVNVKSMALNGGPRAPQTSSQVWAVESLITSLSADDLLASIDVALPLSTDGDPNIEVRFHEETGILIAQGEFAALEMINQVIEQLQQTAYIREAQEATAKRNVENQQEQERRDQMMQARNGFEQDRAEWKVQMEKAQSIINTLRSELASQNKTIQLLEEQVKTLKVQVASKKDKE